MAASDFNYADYLLYAGAKNVNSSLYATVAHGVLGILENQYKIYTEVQTLTSNLWIDDTTFELPAEPVNSITSIINDGDTIDSTTYSWYGRDVELTTAITDTRIPLIIEMEVGYTTIPRDLKLAIYRHIDSIIFQIEKDVDGIEKVVNSTGNTTYFRNNVIPPSVEATYEFYSARQMVLT